MEVATGTGAMAPPRPHDVCLHPLHAMAKRRKIPVVEPDPIRTLHGSLPEATLDLHGLLGREARERVEAFLKHWADQKPGVILRIITGKGNNSDGPPVLRGLVRDLLLGRLAPMINDYVLEMNGGSYLVQLRGGGADR
jgi:DNA-nicking Smr family endonuclease